MANEKVVSLTQYKVDRVRKNGGVEVGRSFKRVPKTNIQYKCQNCHSINFELFVSGQVRCNGCGCEVPILEVRELPKP